MWWLEGIRAQFETDCAFYDFVHFFHWKFKILDFSLKPTKIKISACHTLFRVEQGHIIILSELLILFLFSFDLAISYVFPFSHLEVAKNLRREELCYPRTELMAFFCSKRKNVNSKKNNSTWLYKKRAMLSICLVNPTLILTV